MTFIDWFAGVGGFRRGMELAGHECVGFCEFDKYATASYISMHLLTDEQREYLAALPLKQRQKEILKEEYLNGEWYANDVRRVYAGDIPRADCWCFGFPCQDLSVAGKQAGLTGGQRSSLFYAITRLIRDTPEEDRPSYLFIENVKNLLSINGGWDFFKVLAELDEIGYDAEWQVLNSKDFGVPQNRERVFIVGHLRGHSTAEIFPVQGADGENRVSTIGHRVGYRKNLLTFTPDGISECLDTAEGGGRSYNVALPCFADLTRRGGIVTTETARALEARYYKGAGSRKAESSGVAVPVQIEDNIQIGEKNFNQRNTVNGNGTLCRTLIGSSQTSGSGNEPKVAIPVITPDRAEKRQNGRRFKDDGEPMFTLTGQDRHGVAVGIVDPQGRQGKAVEPLETAPTLRALSHGNEPEVAIDIGETADREQGLYVRLSDDLTVYAVWYEKYQTYITIRKLTPRECFRLQGWTDDYFDKAQFVNSDSQLYKQAGNGVTVNVIRAIAERMCGCVRKEEGD